MRIALISFVFALVASVSCSADDSLATNRDKALHRVHACIPRNEASSRECKYLNQDIEILMEAYKAGDKSVLPTLLRFTYLTDFFDEALLSDPDGFLTAMAGLPKKDQQAVAVGIAGGVFRHPSRERFEKIKLVLASVAELSPTRGVAEVSLKALERNNAALFLNYFPPRTFTSRAADFQVYEYSRDMYELGEKPLWSGASSDETTYRFTHFGALTGPKAVTLTVLPDGSGHITMMGVRQSDNQAEVDHDATIPQEQVLAFLKRLDQSQFWEMPTESLQHGLDGAEWMLEGTHDGKYHIVVRWCPGVYGHLAQDHAFAEAARFLLKLARDKHPGGC